MYLQSLHEFLRLKTGSKNKVQFLFPYLVVLVEMYIYLVKLKSILYYK